MLDCCVVKETHLDFVTIVYPESDQLGDTASTTDVSVPMCAIRQIFRRCKAVVGFQLHNQLSTKHQYCTRDSGRLLAPFTVATHFYIRGPEKLAWTLCDRSKQTVKERALQTLFKPPPRGKQQLMLTLLLLRKLTRLCSRLSCPYRESLVIRRVAMSPRLTAT